MVNLSPIVLDIVNRSTVARTARFADLSSRGTAGTDVRVEVGDVVSVTIFEAASGGLFIPSEAGSRAGNFVQIPNQQVDQSGSIDVPYAGSVRVAGRTARDASGEISRKLANRAIEPQAVVSIVERRGNEVSVLGDVNAPLRFPLDPGGIKLLGAIARAGGPRNPPYETIVTVQRRGRTQQASLSGIVRDPSQNVQILPGDVVYVSREQKIFMALGATPSPGSLGGSNNRRFTFDNDNMTLAEGVSKAGGLATERADARSVFLFRQEPASILRQAGIDTTRYEKASVPTIYTVDLSKAEGLFMANTFYMRDRDIIFVSESPSTDLTKFFAVIGAIAGPAGTAATIANP